MSFANEWLRYLENNNFFILNITLKKKRPERMNVTHIIVDDEIKQFLPYERGMSLPDEIAFNPVKVESVKIVTSEGFTFNISKDKKMKIRFADYEGCGLDPKKEEELIKDAKNLGYKVSRVEVYDV